jgi:hypothetical protein
MYYAKLKPATVEKNFLLVKCALYTKNMMLTEGSIILGSIWHHENCFDKSKQIFANPKILHKIGAN